MVLVYFTVSQSYDEHAYMLGSELSNSSCDDSALPMIKYMIFRQGILPCPSVQASPDVYMATCMRTVSWSLYSVNIKTLRSYFTGIDSFGSRIGDWVWGSIWLPGYIVALLFSRELMPASQNWADAYHEFSTCNGGGVMNGRETDHVEVRASSWSVTRTTIPVQAFCRNAMHCDLVRYDHIMSTTTLK